MADSLNTTNLSRRSILGTGIAAAGVLAAGALPAPAMPAGSDAKLLQLCRNYLRLERMHDSLCKAADDALVERRDREAKRKQKVPPPRPEALKGRFRVWPDACGPFGTVFLEHPLFKREELAEVANGKATIQSAYLKTHAYDDSSLVPAPEASILKARELLAIYDDWAAKGGVPKETPRRRSRAEVKADRALERVNHVQAETAKAIAAIPAQTMAGIRAKLHLVTSDPLYRDGRDEFGSDYPPMVAIGASLLRDLRRIDPSARLTPPMAV